MFQAQAFIGSMVTSMLVTDIETKCVGVKFEMLMADLLHRKSHKYNEKNHQHDTASSI